MVFLLVTSKSTNTPGIIEIKVFNHYLPGTAGNSHMFKGTIAISDTPKTKNGRSKPPTYLERELFHWSRTSSNKLK